MRITICRTLTSISILLNLNAFLTRKFSSTICLCHNMLLIQSIDTFGQAI